MPSPFLRRLLRLLPALLLVVVACSDSSEPTTPDPDPDPDDEPVRMTGDGYDLTIASDAVALSEALTAEALVSADSASHTYGFDAAGLATAGVELRSGQVLMIPGRAVRRIAGVSTSGGVTTVTTSYATLNEAIENGTVEWDEPVRFTPEVIQGAAMRVGDRWIKGRTNQAGGTVEWEFPVGANTVKARLTAGGSSAELEVQVTHSTGGPADAVFTAKTTFQEMQSSAQIDIEDGETRNVDYESSGMGGTVELSVAAAGSGLDEFAFEWPEAMIRFPITIGPVPAMLIIKAQVVTRLVVNGEASATASTSFTWGGDAGFEYNGFEIDTKASANLGLPGVGASEADSGAGIGNPVDAQFGFAAPRIEVALFGETIVPFLRPEFFVGSALSWGPVCKSAYVKYLVQAGIDLRFLGSTLATKQDTVAGPHEVRESQNDCAEGAAAPARPGVELPELSFPVEVGRR